MSAGYLLFLVIGRVFIFIGNKFVQQNEVKIKFLNRLLSCSLCTGVWVYTIMSWLLGYYVFEDWSPYVPFVSELAAGCFSSLLVYYVEHGWRSLYEVIVV
jgi:hypothetical protein